MVTPARPHRIEAREIPGADNIRWKSTIVDAAASKKGDERKGDPGMMETEKKTIFIFLLDNDRYTGITASSEEEAREIAELRNYHVLDLVRTEEIKTTGGMNNE